MCLPGREAVGDRGHILEPGRAKHRRRDTRAIAAGADRGDRPIARQSVELLRQLAGPDVGRARDVAGLVLGRLADIDDERRLRPARREQPGQGVDREDGPGLDRAPGTAPRLEAAVDVAEERLEPDAQRLAGQVVEMGMVLDQEDDRPVRLDDPAEPRPERRARRDRQRAGDVLPRMVARRARIDDQRPAAESRRPTRRPTTARSPARPRRATAARPGSSVASGRSSAGRSAGPRAAPARTHRSPSAGGAGRGGVRSRSSTTTSTRSRSSTASRRHGSGRPSPTPRGAAGRRAASGTCPRRTPARGPRRAGRSARPPRPAANRRSAAGTARPPVTCRRRHS